MKLLSLITVSLVVLLVVDLTAAWSFYSREESDQDNGNSESVEEEEVTTTSEPPEETTTTSSDVQEEISAEVSTSGPPPDEAFLTGTNRSFTFGRCSTFDGQAPHAEILASRCGDPGFYLRNILTFNMTVTKFITSYRPSRSCCDANCQQASAAGSKGSTRVEIERCPVTCIKALDLKEGGSSRANVTIAEGRLGDHFVRVRVDGELGKGYYYLVQVFTSCTGVTWTSSSS